MQTHEITISRSARFHTEGTVTEHLTDLWIVCHGYSQLAKTFLGYFSSIASPHRLLVAPEALSRFYVDHVRGEVGASWMTREFRDAEVGDYVAYLDQVYDAVADVDRDRVTIRCLGFSQGVATASRWFARTNRPVDHLILWGERLPTEFRDAESVHRFNTARVSLVHGTRDKFLSRAVLDEERDTMLELGLRHEWIEFEGGHRLDKETLRSLADS